MNNKVLLIVMLFVISFTGCRFWGVRGSGDIETETRDLETFTGIEASGAYQINIRAGEKQNVTITADDNLLQYIDTRVRSGKLIIDSRRELNPRREIKIDITVEELNYIGASGASEIYAEYINSSNFEIDMSGACDIDLEGNTEKLYISLSGAGNINAKDFRAKDVRVDISGASNASVNASESLEAEVSGVGSVDYYGDPDRVISDISGVGSINRK